VIIIRKLSIRYVGKMHRFVTLQQEEGSVTSLKSLKVVICAKDNMLYASKCNKHKNNNTILIISRDYTSDLCVCVCVCVCSTNCPKATSGSHFEDP
jgi:hypothetical protein